MNDRKRGSHDPLMLIFAPILVVVGLAFLMVGADTFRVMGLLFLASGALWLLNAWRGPV